MLICNHEFNVESGYFFAGIKTSLVLKKNKCVPDRMSSFIFLDFPVDQKRELHYFCFSSSVYHKGSIQMWARERFLSGFQ